MHLFSRVAAVAQLYTAEQQQQRNMQAEWERMTLPQQQSSSIHRQSGSKAAAYAGEVGGNDPPTAAKQQQHMQAEWEGVILPQQQKPSPITTYQIQPINTDWCCTIIMNRS